MVDQRPKPAWSAGLDRKLRWRLLNDFREAATELARRIGIDPDLGRRGDGKTVGRTFVAERDNRAGAEARAHVAAGFRDCSEPTFRG